MTFRSLCPRLGRKALFRQVDVEVVVSKASAPFFRTLQLLREVFAKELWRQEDDDEEDLHGGIQQKQDARKDAVRYVAPREYQWDAPGALPVETYLKG